MGHHFIIVKNGRYGLELYLVVAGYIQGWYVLWSRATKAKSDAIYIRVCNSFWVK